MVSKICWARLLSSAADAAPAHKTLVASNAATAPRRCVALNEAFIVHLLKLACRFATLMVLWGEMRKGWLLPVCASLNFYRPLAQSSLKTYTNRICVVCALTHITMP